MKHGQNLYFDNLVQVGQKLSHQVKLSTIWIPWFLVIALRPSWLTFLQTGLVLQHSFKALCNSMWMWHILFSITCTWWFTLDESITVSFYKVKKTLFLYRLFPCVLSNLIFKMSTRNNIIKYFIITKNSGFYDFSIQNKLNVYVNCI